MIEHTDASVPNDQPYVDPVIEAYKKNVDRNLLRQTLAMTVEERLIRLERLVAETVISGESQLMRGG